MSSGTAGPILRTVLARHLAAAAAAACLALSPAFADPPTTAVVPAGTLIMLSMDDTVSSQESEVGQVFRFHVDEPVRIASRLVIPRGATGIGEVLHASRSTRDEAGEIVVAARSLNVGDHEVRLRTFVGGTANRDVDALSVQIMVRGQYDSAPVMKLGRNGVASARTAEDVELPVLEEEGNDGTFPSAEPPEVLTGDHAKVVFFRQRSAQGSLVIYKVREGAVELGKLTSGTWFAIDAIPGRHSYHVLSEVGDDLTLETNAGETYYVIAGVSWGILWGRANLAPSNKRTFETMVEQQRLVERAPLASVAGE